MKIPPEKQWAHGCGQCQFGLIDPPAEVKGNLIQVRQAQANMGELSFCACKAGQMYRKRLTGYCGEYEEPSQEGGPSVHWEGERVG